MASEAELNLQRSVLTSQPVNTPSLSRVSSKEGLNLLLNAAEMRRETGATLPKVKKGGGKAKRSPTKPPPCDAATQLKWLATAFKLCPSPGPAELQLLQQRLQMPEREISDWFSRRRLLDEWVRRDPNMTPADVASALARCKQRLSTQASPRQSVVATPVRDLDDCEAEDQAEPPPIAASVVS